MYITTCMYLKSLNVVVVFTTNIYRHESYRKFILLICFYSTDKKGDYIECCFSGLKYLLSTLTYNSSHLFLPIIITTIITI